ncbi:hypothetical protein DP113_30660 [Brasilonema octagenarum UFV-E1]|jgi:hypothetical protein|uniref:Uncharacterized protein n=2 Tax=Brasilonema TaxID=383614 RepID=A0A856MNH2_9CYAN|nr:hypothetical protein [Brasilonema octagenarum UFV-OR1]QDL11654.1 hypothetical protein DP114_30520 [Brasilonema sennae CENA114]QDL18034.1 hypothetical protein DP113_30660 [Brasilonema octagenarum UFV-E1]
MHNAGKSSNKNQTACGRRAAAKLATGLGKPSTKMDNPCIFAASSQLVLPKFLGMAAKIHPDLESYE